MAIEMGLAIYSRARVTTTHDPYLSERRASMFPKSMPLRVTRAHHRMAADHISFYHKTNQRLYHTRIYDGRFKKNGLRQMNHLTVERIK